MPKAPRGEKHPADVIGTPRALYLIGQRVT
jgi:hypothetical protein